MTLGSQNHLTLTKLHFYPWEARWVENPEGRPRQKLEQEKKKKNKKEKEQKNNKERCKEKNKKRKSKKETNEKNWKEENHSSQGWKPERAALAKVRAQKERLNTRVCLSPKLRKAWFPCLGYVGNFIPKSSRKHTSNSTVAMWGVWSSLSSLYPRIWL